MANSAHVLDINESDFGDGVLLASAEKPVLVDFWATWCRPCTMMSPVLDDLADSESEKIRVTKINIEDNPEIAAQYQITAIPAMLVFSNGEPVKRITGAKSKAALRTELAEFL